MILTEKQVLELARNMVGQAGTLNQIAPRMGVDVDELRLGWIEAHRDGRWGRAVKEVAKERRHKKEA